MLLSPLLLLPSSVHAATGVVSVNGGTQVLALGTDTTASVPINIQGSDALNGFDIQVLADPTILSAASVSLTGSVLASPRIVIECINGILVAGSTCAPQDANGVVHLGVAQLGSPTTAPTSGLLFTINYNIISHTPTTPISFNTGCSGTSVSGVCVTVANAGVALSETAVGSTFSNLNDFTIAAAFAKISTPSGVAITDTISYAALGAFSDTLNEAVTGPCTLATGSVNLAFGPTGTDTLSCSSTTNGDFVSNVTATGASSGVIHFTVVKIHVAPTGFASTLNHASINISAGSSDSTTIITVQGVSGFSGTVAITATGGPTGLTGSPSPSSVTLTADASGYSTATSTLTVAVASTVAPGTYALAITGGSTLSVVVQPKDFSITASPTVESVPRGGSAAATLTLCSLGNFAGTVTFSASIATSNLDAGSGTGTISPSFLPASVTLTAGGCAQTAFAAGTVKIGTTPNPANTATGNYIVTITASSGANSHPATVSFNVFDFVIGTTYCPGNTPLFGTPDAEFDPALVGEQCNTFTLTTQTRAQGGAQAHLWATVNVLGGMTTFGASGFGIQGGDPTGPGRGVLVPQLHRSVCMFQTYFANGTLIPRDYLVANGPIVRADDFGGCRGFGEVFPGDFEAPLCVPPDVPANLDCALPNNPDFFHVSANALTNTKPGTYFVDICGLDGTLINCQRVTLIVVQAPIVSQFRWTHQGTISQSHGGHFQLRVLNTDTSFTIFAQVSITATGNFGDTVNIVLLGSIAPGSDAPYNMFASFTLSEVGETFVFTSSIAVSATDAGALTGTSTLQSVSSTFTVAP